MYWNGAHLQRALDALAAWKQTRTTRPPEALYPEAATLYDAAECLFVEPTVVDQELLEAVLAWGYFVNRTGYATHRAPLELARLSELAEQAVMQQGSLAPYQCDIRDCQGMSDTVTNIDVNGTLTRFHFCSAHEALRS